MAQPRVRKEYLSDPHAVVSPLVLYEYTVLPSTSAAVRRRLAAHHSTSSKQPAIPFILTEANKVGRPAPACRKVDAINHNV